MFMRPVVAVLLALLALPLPPFCADRNWQIGILVSAERHDDPGDREQHQQTKSHYEDNGNPGSYNSSTDTTAEPSDLHYNWMDYTVSSGNRLYLVRLMVNLPWAKKPKADVGEKVEYAVDGTKFYFHNPDGSEARADIVKTTAQMPVTSPPSPPTKHPDAPQ